MRGAGRSCGLLQRGDRAAAGTGAAAAASDSKCCGRDKRAATKEQNHSEISYWNLGVMPDAAGDQRSVTPARGEGLRHRRCSVLANRRIPAVLRCEVTCVTVLGAGRSEPATGLAPRAEGALGLFCQQGGGRVEAARLRSERAARARVERI